MKKILLVGGRGFVGCILAEMLKTNGKQVYITKTVNENILANYPCYNMDLLNISEIEHVINEIRPDEIYHLAAQSSVALSWKNPTMTIDVNVKGVVNLLETIRSIDIKPRILIVGSGEEYGYIKPEECPINENNLPRPGNIYAATKVAQNMISTIYANAYDMDIVLTRSFNHIGPGQSPTFVVSDFCKQVAEIEAGIREPIIYVGNLSVKRDFSDVRDVCRAYMMLMEKGISGETYNVGSGCSISINEILNKILSYSSKKIKIEVDSNKLRPVDILNIEADIGKIVNDIGWNTEISIDDTIKCTLNYWRQESNLF